MPTRDTIFYFMQLDKEVQPYYQGQAAYFYHPDHLGSTSLVTNSYGEITQNISYIPYGEVFVEETAGGWQSPYYFNAKELK